MEFIIRDFKYNNREICGITLSNVYEGEVLCDCYCIEEIDYHLSNEFKYDGYFYDLIEECKNTFTIIECLKYDTWIDFNTKEDRDVFIEKMNSRLILERLINLNGI